MTRDRVSAVLLLAFSVVYGFMSTRIEMFPGAELDPFTPQTLPRALAVMCGALAVAIFFFSSRGRGRESFASAFAGLDWGRAVALLVLMVLFAVALDWLGFVPAAVLFLAAGFRVLGITRLRTIVLGSVPLAVGFWFLLSRVLEIYLAPGELWYLIGVVQ